MMQHQSRPYLRRSKLQPLHIRHGLFSIASSFSPSSSSSSGRCRRDTFFFASIVLRSLLMMMMCSFFSRVKKAVFAFFLFKISPQTTFSHFFSLFFSALFLSFLVVHVRERERERRRERESFLSSFGEGGGGIIRCALLSLFLFRATRIIRYRR